MLDFAENLFIVQDAGFHWDDSQATIYPFVLYYMDQITNSFHHKAYAYISDQTIHDTNDPVYT